MNTVDSSIYCSVPGCTSWRNNNPEIVFHEFPDKGKNKVYFKTDENKIEFMDREQAWRTRLKIDNEDTKYLKVCCLHFIDNDYMRFAHSIRRLLKQTAVPSQNLPQLLDVSCDQNTDQDSDKQERISFQTDGPSLILSQLLTNGCGQNVDTEKNMHRSRTEYMREYRKRKREEKVETEVPMEEPIYKARTSTERTRDMRARIKQTILASALTSNDVTVNDFQSSSYTRSMLPLPKIRGRRIIDLQYFFEKLQSIGSHRTNRRACSIATLSIVREISIGLNSDIQIYCSSCNTNFTLPISDPVLTNLAEVNRSAVAGTVAAGMDYSGLTMLFASMGIPTMTQDKFQELLTDDVPHKPVEVFIKQEDDATSVSCDIAIKEEFPEILG